MKGQPVESKGLGAIATHLHIQYPSGPTYDYASRGTDANIGPDGSGKRISNKRIER